MPSIEERPLARGGVRYVVRVRDAERGKYTSATFATHAEADQFARDVADRGVPWALGEYRREKDLADEMTLNEWADLHFDSLTAPSGATVRRYRRIYRECWQPDLGHMRLSQIERVHVSKALNALAGSDKTIKNKWAVLTHMLKLAAADGKIARSPTLGVKLPRRSEHEREEHRYLTHGEFWRILEATPPHWRPLIMFLAGSGCRWGEAVALTVGDVDTENSAVRITKAEKQDPDNPSKSIIGPPKSRKSRRTIGLPPETMTELEPLLAGRRRDEPLFTAPRGGTVRHRTFYRDVWRKHCCARSGIAEPYPRLHDIRHSHVAWLLAAGVPGGLATIQARLGHEKIATTMDVYGHLLPELRAAADQATAAVFGSHAQVIEGNIVKGEIG